MESTPTKRRFCLQPRFSLRALFLAFTAFAIGFPIWYRWPYEEAEPVSTPGIWPSHVRITTWQRQWGGGRLKHGPERLVMDNQTYSITTYRDGRKNGPFTGYKLWTRNVGQNRVIVLSSEPELVGQFADDEKEGDWTDTVNGKYGISTWHRGKQTQPMRIIDPPERK